MKKKKILLISIIILLIYIGANAASIWFYAQKDETRHADAALVLGAATYDGTLSNAYTERLNHAVLLYREGYVDKIIVTGGIAEGNTISDARAAADYLLTLKIPEDDILLEEQSAVTQENIIYARAVMKEHSLSTALLVSDPLHMKRAMLLAKHAGVKCFSSPTQTSCYKTWRTKLPFLVRETFLYIGYTIYFISLWTLSPP